MTIADLPPLENDGPPASPFEFMPAWRFYLPLVPHILGLAFKHGGLFTGQTAGRYLHAIEHRPVLRGAGQHHGGRLT